VTTHYTWGVVAGANALLRDGASDYLYGPGGQVIEQVVGSTASFYVHDQLGSTVALTNGSGAVSGSYAYNTYGKVTAHTGASTALQYGGGYADAETGLVYLQQRYYDPGTGLFLTIDPDLAATGQPYAYVSDDPLNNIDPLGLSWYNPASWSKKTWTNVGIGLGAVALAATGVGVFADLSLGASIVVGGVALGAGGGATALDYSPCLNGGDTLACGGFVMGTAGLLYGVAGVGFDVAEIAGYSGEALDGVGKFLDVQSMLLGAGGTAIDTYGLFGGGESNGGEADSSGAGAAVRACR